LAATVAIGLHEITPERRDAIFKIFDVRDQGRLTREDIRKAFNKIGRNVSEEQLDEIFNEFDADGDQTIDREEWDQVVNTIIDTSKKIEQATEQIKEADSLEEDNSMEGIDINDEN